MPLAHTPRPGVPNSHTTDDAMTQLYDAHMAHFSAGDHGQVELGAEENRVAVREMLQAAAQRRGLQLTFRRGRGPLTFRVEALQKPARRAAQRSASPAAPAQAPAAAEAATPPPAEVPAPAAAAPEPISSAPHKPVRPRKATPAAQRPAPQQTAEPSQPAPPAPAARQAAPAPASNRPRPQRGTRPPEQRASNRRDGADNRRKNDDRRPGNSRYDDMLPRWMREGERPAGQAGRARGDGKRRTRS